MLAVQKTGHITFSEGGANTPFTYRALEDEPSLDCGTTPDQNEDEEFRRSHTTYADAEYWPQDSNSLNFIVTATVPQSCPRRTHDDRVATTGKTNPGPPVPPPPGQVRSTSKSKCQNNPKQLPGPKLPSGVTGLGPTGTWVVDDVWHADAVLSTDQMPSDREEEEHDTPIDEATQKGPASGQGVRLLTPLPSFVTGD